MTLLSIPQLAIPLTSNGLVTDLCLILEDAERKFEFNPDQPEDAALHAVADQAAAALAVLAEGGIATADPDNWWGLAALSTDHPIHGVDEHGEPNRIRLRSEEHTSELQSRGHLAGCLLLY